MSMDHMLVVFCLVLHRERCTASHEAGHTALAPLTHTIVKISKSKKIEPRPPALVFLVSTRTRPFGLS